MWGRDKHQETPPKRLDDSSHAPPCLQLPLTVGLDGAEAEVIRKPVLLAWPGFFSFTIRKPPLSLARDWTGARSRVIPLQGPTPPSHGG